MWGRATRPSCLLLLLRSGLLGRFLGSSLLLRLSGLFLPFVLFFVRRRSLLHLGLLLRQLRSLEALPVKRNLSNSHRSVRLPVPAQLLILLLALVVKNQNLRAAAFFHQLADHPRSRFRLADLAFPAR